MAESGPELRELSDCFKRAAKKQVGESEAADQAENSTGTGCGFLSPEKPIEPINSSYWPETPGADIVQQCWQSH
jgi:hypothetical protein